MTELGKEYASALFELARENSCEKEFSDALGLIERQFEASRSMRNCFRLPIFR